MLKYFHQLLPGHFIFMGFLAILFLFFSGIANAQNSDQTISSSWTSKDGTRSVKVMTGSGDTFLYDVSAHPSLKPVYLATDVKTVRFTGQGSSLQIVLDLNNGTTQVFDANGTYLNPGLPEASPKTDFPTPSPTALNNPPPQPQPTKTATSIGFGLLEGVDFADQNIASNSSSVLNGYTGGLFGDMKLLNFLSIQMEANYTPKGSKSFSSSNYYQNGHYIYASNSYTFEYQYLEIPFLLKGNIDLAPQLKVNLLAGPYIAFLLNQTTTLVQGYEVITISYTSTTSIENDTSMRTAIDDGLMFGGGIEWENYMVNIRYDFGLNSVTNSNAGVITNGVLYLVGEYRFF